MTRVSVKETFTKSTLRILQTDFSSFGQNEGASDILVRGKYLVGILSPQTKAKTRFVERVSQVYELFHGIFNFTTRSVNKNRPIR